MRKIIGIILSITILCSCQSTEQNIHTEHKTNSKEPLNILWLVTEDMSPYIRPFGDSTIETPHLEQLANEGVRYTNFYSVAGVCSPSRAAIALGMYPNRIGAHHMRTGDNPEMMATKGLKPYEAMPPPEAKMMSETFRRNGYYTSNNYKEDYQFKPPVTAWNESSREAHWKNRPDGKPFFSIFNNVVTHEIQIWLKAEDSLYIPENTEVPIPPYFPETEVVKKDIRRMYSNIVEMDNWVGEKMAELEEAGLLENTIVIWYSDHGGPLPRQKRLLYDSGLEVPMIIRFPNKERAGEIDDQLISFIDLAPTMFSLVGIEPPSHLDGRAFLGKYKVDKPRDYIHASADRFDGQEDMIRAVRDKQFKYLKNFRTNDPYYLPVKFRENMPLMQELLRLNKEGKLDEYQAQWFRQTKPKEELFDCVNDPHELHNLANDPNYAEKLKELRVECERWMQAIDDKGLMPEQEYLASIWENMEQPVTAKPTIIAKENQVEISSTTKGASIAYQIISETDSLGKEWEIYTNPITIQQGEKLFIYAHRIGFKPSEVVEHVP